MRPTLLGAVLLVLSAGCSLFNPPRYGASCQADGDCGPGYLCQSGHCLPEAAVDGGTEDGGGVDTGVPDAGSPDGSPRHLLWMKEPGAGADHYFGAAVAAGPGEVLVGAWSGADDGKGEVYSFTRVAPGQWTPAAALPRPPSLPVGSSYGSSLALRGDRLAVGAPAHSADQGRVHIYARNGGGWQHQVALAASTAELGDGFGEHIALSGDGAILAIAAPSESEGTRVYVGAVYIFEDDAGTWRERQRLAAPETQDAVSFGSDLALNYDGSRLVVGGLGENISGATRAGAAYLYERSGDSWTRLTRLAPSPQYAGWQTGTAVALGAGQILVGSPGSDGDQGTPNERDGEVTVFAQPSSSWEAAQTLYPPGGGEQRWFGAALAVDGSWLAVGRASESGETSGDWAVYLYGRAGSSWVLRNTLQPASAEHDDGYGRQVALAEDGKLLAVGAPHDDAEGVRSGSVYIFEL